MLLTYLFRFLHLLGLIMFLPKDPYYMWLIGVGAYLEYLIIKMHKDEMFHVKHKKGDD